MTVKSYKLVLFLVLLGYFGFAVSGTSSTQDDETSKDKTADISAVKESTTGDVLVGNFEAGEQRYKKSCINCHGAAGKGAASYPKISGQEISYTTEKLETYRDGIKIGPNSSLMIMMAKPLSDEEIANLAAYLKDVTF